MEPFFLRNIEYKVQNTDAAEHQKKYPPIIQGYLYYIQHFIDAYDMMVYFKVFFSPPLHYIFLCLSENHLEISRGDV